MYCQNNIKVQAMNEEYLKYCTGCTKLIDQVIKLKNWYEKFIYKIIKSYSKMRIKADQLPK